MTETHTINFQSSNNKESNSDTVFLALEELRLLRLSDVLKLMPIKRATWWKGIRDGVFPRPVKFGPRVSYWRVCDIRKVLMKMNDGTLKPLRKLSNSAKGEVLSHEHN